MHRTPPVHAESVTGSGMQGWDDHGTQWGKDGAGAHGCIHPHRHMHVHAPGRAVQVVLHTYTLHPTLQLHRHTCPSSPHHAPTSLLTTTTFTSHTLPPFHMHARTHTRALPLTPPHLGTLSDTDTQTRYTIHQGLSETKPETLSTRGQPRVSPRQTHTRCSDPARSYPHARCPTGDRRWGSAAHRDRGGGQA